MRAKISCGHGGFLDANLNAVDNIEAQWTAQFEDGEYLEDGEVGDQSEV